MKTNKGLTLVELLMAIALFSLVVLALANIDYFSNFHVLSSDHRAKTQNEVSYVLDHMKKQITQAIGDTSNQPVYLEDSNNRVKVRIDADTDGQLDAVATDYYIAYQYDSTSHEVRYYSSYSPVLGAYTVLSDKITAFTPTFTWTAGIGATRNNYLDIKVTGCWDPSAAMGTCGTPNNPSVEMTQSITMPMVSAN